VAAAAPSTDPLATVTVLDWQAGREQDGKSERRGVIGLEADTGSLRGGTKLARLGQPLDEPGGAQHRPAQHLGLRVQDTGLEQLSADDEQDATGGVGTRDHDPLAHRVEQ
jgi:hypothetical protein